jgi:hypothetical protein
MPRDSRLYMTFPIDVHRHPKFRRLSDSAKWAFVEMNGEARIAENDGRFTADEAEFMWPADVLAELTGSHPTRPLVARDGSDYVIRDYAEHQFTKADRDELTRKRREAGVLGAAKRESNRQASAKQVLSKVEQSQAGIGIGTGLPPSKEGGPPPRFCVKHPTGTDAPCRACGDARKAREDWDKAEKDKPSPVVRRPKTCTVHAEYPLPCIRCAEGT